MDQMIEIKDFDAPELDVFARMTENQLLYRDEPEKAMFIAESPKVVDRALDAGCVPVCLLVEKSQLGGEAACTIERCGQVPVFVSSAELLKNLTGFGMTRGMLCAMKRPPLLSAEEVCRGKKRIAVMERVMNPTNVGAIFRSAAAMGIEAVLLTTDCSNPLYRRSIRVSMGNVFQVPWAWVDLNAGGINEVLHSLGFRTASLALSDNSVRIDDPMLMAEERLAIILGSEGDGLLEETIAGSDYVVKIPMKNGVDSLNVAAASAVAFWQLRAEE